MRKLKAGVATATRRGHRRRSTRTRPWRIFCAVSWVAAYRRRLESPLLEVRFIPTLEDLLVQPAPRTADTTADMVIVDGDYPNATILQVLLIARRRWPRTLLLAPRAPAPSPWTALDAGADAVFESIPDIQERVLSLLSAPPTKRVGRSADLEPLRRLSLAEHRLLAALAGLHRGERARGVRESLAMRLGVSVHAVRESMARIRTKLGLAGSRATALPLFLKCLEVGLLKLPPVSTGDDGEQAELIRRMVWSGRVPAGTSPILRRYVELVRGSPHHGIEA
jgi:hypothetical protein